MKYTILHLFIFSFTTIVGQNYLIGPSSPIKFEIIDNERNTLPLDFKFFSHVDENKTQTIELTINQHLSLRDTNIEESDFQHLSIRQTRFNLDEVSAIPYFDIDKASYFHEKRITFYLDVHSGFNASNVEKTIKLLLTVNGEPSKWYSVVITPENLLTYSEADYRSNHNVTLDKVLSVEPHQGKFLLNGSRNGKSTKVIVIPETAGRFDVSQSFTIANTSPSKLVSIVSNTIKVRREVSLPASDELASIRYASSVQTGFRNLGINLNLYETRYDNYDFRGRKNSQSLGIGIVALFGFERINKDEFLPEIENPETRDVFAPSLGLTVSYKFNGFSIMAIPLGFDLLSGTSNEGWVHLNRPWFGFGIGFNPNFFR